MIVTAVSASAVHNMRKPGQASIQLIAGLGVRGDAHCGTTVKHRSRVARDPTAPNLRQVHLIHSELHDELRVAGFDIKPGDMGENITTRGIDLLGLPQGTQLAIGEECVIDVMGLRNPCTQLDDLAHGLMAATLGRDSEGRLIRKAGIMAVVRRGGVVKAGDAITITLPVGEARALQPV